VRLVDYLEELNRDVRSTKQKIVHRNLLQYTNFSSFSCVRV